MRLTEYTFPRSSPVRDAIEAWELENDATVHIIGWTGYENHIPEDDDCTVRLVLGYLPPTLDGRTHYWETYRHVNLNEWTGDQWQYTTNETLHDQPMPTVEQQHDFEALPWVGTFNDGEDDLPFWWINRDEANLHFVGAYGYFGYLRTEIVTGMLDEALTCVGDPGERELRAYERALETLSAYYREGATADLRNLRDEIGNNTRALAGHESSALQLRNELRDKQARLDLLLEQANAVDAAAQARAAFDAMQEHPQIQNVRLRVPKLVIETVGLDIEHPITGASGYLGQFTITLDIQSGEVQLKNNDNARNGHDHPHVFLGGPCFGEMGSTIMQLTRAGQLLAAVEMVFVFLGSVNIRDDWGRTLSYWLEPQLERPVEPVAELVEA